MSDPVSVSGIKVWTKGDEFSRSLRSQNENQSWNLWVECENWGRSIRGPVTFGVCPAGPDFQVLETHDNIVYKHSKLKQEETQTRPSQITDDTDWGSTAAAFSQCTEAAVEEKRSTEGQWVKWGLWETDSPSRSANTSVITSSLHCQISPLQNRQSDHNRQWEDDGGLGSDPWEHTDTHCGRTFWFLLSLWDKAANVSAALVREAPETQPIRAVRSEPIQNTWRNRVLHPQLYRLRMCRRDGLGFIEGDVTDPSTVTPACLTTLQTRSLPPWHRTARHRIVMATSPDCRSPQCEVSVSMAMEQMNGNPSLFLDCGNRAGGGRGRSQEHVAACVCDLTR